ncbi:hypothetical protein EON81_11275 [bacterium]|nr:MAG: hypothetical protein EON81_11275 [bacterium]
MSVFVGLDCGGSSCRIIAVDKGGRLLFQGQSGAANLTSTPENRLRRNLSHAAQGCPSPDFVCGCFAGLVDDDSRARGVQQLKHLFPKATVRAEPDYYAAFHAAPPGTHIVLIAGTGSLVCSQHEGELRKSGGGGYLIGDEGSAFQYGRDAIREYLRNPEDVSDALRETVIKLFGEVSHGEIVSAIYRAPTPAGLLAKLAKPLGVDARNGLPYALKCLERNSLALAEVVRDHLRRHFVQESSAVLCLAGGLWKGSSVYRDSFAVAMEQTEGAKITLVRPTEAPIHGAVRIAREMAYGN